MRSRYSAFALGLADYLLATWHPSTRPRAVELDADDRWFLLDIVRTERGGMLDDEGIVEFRACFRSASDPGEAHEAHEVHETSRFVRVERRWMYLDAV
jgi:SEC-C motif-containing protein